MRTLPSTRWKPHGAMPSSDGRAPVLGAKFDRHGSAYENVASAEEACWRRFWIGAGSRRGKSLPARLLVKDIERCCLPSWIWRSSWWPLNQIVIKSVGACQRALIACIVNCRREAGDVDATHARNKHRMASGLLPPTQRWGYRLACKCIAWFEHVFRDHAKAWCGILC